MSPESERVEAIKNIIEKRGKPAIDIAAKEILQSPYKGGIVSAATKHFVEVTLRGFLPVFPALISLSCEAVGGKTEKTPSIGAAMSLIAGAADIHDDIIDQSETKYSKKTVFGRFGKDIALLAGDALLMQGSMLLHRECDSLPKEQKNAILKLVLQALFEISKAEAEELSLNGKSETAPDEYLRIVKLKAVVPEVHCKIGGILGNADEKTVTSLGRYGRTFGIVAAIRDEFTDLLDYPELNNRIKNGCPPLPMLYAFRDPDVGGQIHALIESQKLTRKSANKLVAVTMCSKGVQELKAYVAKMINSEVTILQGLVDNLELRKEAELLLHVLTEGL